MPQAINITGKEQCSGCGACASACPVNAILFEPDEEGFRYPRVTEKCINCGKCRAICPFVSGKKPETEPSFPLVYAAWSKNDKIRKSCSSGGIFGILAKETIARGGVVFGAQYDDHLVLKHTYVDFFEDLHNLFTSKYVQSEENGTFQKVLDLRKRNIPVLYCGTPCQIASLRNIVGNPDPGLLLVDFVCHGVPSPKYLERYKQFLEKKNNAKLLDLKMRITEGWGYGEVQTFQRDTRKGKRIFVIPDAALSPYLQPFFRGENYRYSCYRCPFANPQRPGDITICDFWGAESFLSFSQREFGVSGVMINTGIGKNFWDTVVNDLVILPQPLNRLTKQNENLNYSAKCPSSRRDFYLKWRSNSPEKILRSYYSTQKWYSLELKNIVRKVIQKLLLKKMINYIYHQ